MLLVRLVVLPVMLLGLPGLPLPRLQPRKLLLVLALAQRVRLALRQAQCLELAG